jgi:hypothetical protein
MEENENEKTKDEITFPNIAAVLEWLQHEGWKISKSSLYLHAREGRLRIKKDGKYHFRDVIKYARLNLKRLDGLSVRTGKIDTAVEKKVYAEVRKLEASARISELKLQVLEGKYVERSKFDMELAAHAAIFKHCMEQFALTRAADVVRLVTGDEKKIPALINFLNEEITGWLSEMMMRKQEWEVVFDDIDESIPEEESETQEFADDADKPFEDDVKQND